MTLHLRTLIEQLFDSASGAKFVLSPPKPIRWESTEAVESQSTAVRYLNVPPMLQASPAAN